jgi:hypothetical protein
MLQLLCRRFTYTDRPNRNLQLPVTSIIYNIDKTVKSTFLYFWYKCTTRVI